MENEKEYQKFSIAALLQEEKKLKRNEILSAILIGFLVGVMIYGVVMNGFGFLYLFIPIVLILGIYKNSQRNKKKLKEIQTFIDDKKD